MDIGITQIQYTPGQIASREQLYKTLPAPVQEGNLFGLDDLSLSIIAAAGVILLVLVVRG